jgi:hypothetical protein
MTLLGGPAERESPRKFPIEAKEPLATAQGFRHDGGEQDKGVLAPLQNPAQFTDQAQGAIGQKGQRLNR